MVAAILQGSHSRHVPAARTQEDQNTHILCKDAVQVYPESIVVLKSLLCPLKPPYYCTSQPARNKFFIF